MDKQPTPEQLAALDDYKASHGRNWKQSLILAWMRGSDDREPNGYLLRQVRNTFGPAWLSLVKI